jgi:DtxR family manganese transport transcriptional regulator
MKGTTQRGRETGAGRSPQRATNGYRRTRSDHAQETAEDYVELIDDLIREAGEARAVDVARRLGVTHVTVTKTLARLKREGLLTSEPYRAVFLTAKGKRLAGRSRKRHELVVDFLLVLGVPCADAETDAEGIEHHISPRTLRAMKRHVGRRRTAVV